MHRVTEAEYNAVRTAFGIILAGRRPMMRARFKRLPHGFRLVCDDLALAADFLNRNGYYAANGQSFDRFSIDGNQFFVRYRAGV